MSPPGPARRFGDERIPLSPVRPGAWGQQASFSHVEATDKENNNCFVGNENIFKDDTSTKPLLICLDGDSAESTPSNTVSSLGRPPKSPESQTPAPKVRLCAELASNGMIPAIILAGLACILAALQCDEDHSYDALMRAIHGSTKDLSESESLLVWVMVIALLVFICAALICGYVCCNAATSARSQKALDLKKDLLPRSSHRRRSSLPNSLLSY